MDIQEETRIRLRNLINEEGIKQNFICKKINNLDVSVMSRFLKGQKELYPETLDLLIKFLDSKMQ
jgi:hypothetical protein